MANAIQTSTVTGIGRWLGVLLALFFAPTPVSAEGDLSSIEDPRWIIVKYADGSKVEWRNGGFADRRGRTLELREADGRDALVTRIFTAPAEVYARQRAARRQKGLTPRKHLELFFSVKSPNAATTWTWLKKIQDDTRVELAYVPTLAPPSPSSTPDFSDKQRYLGSINGGPPPSLTPLFVRHLWQTPGGKGRGVRFVDIEYGWNLGHEDLPSNVTVLGPTPIIPSNLNAAWERHHGTASLGIVAGQHNGFGIDGIAPDATVRVAGSVTSGGSYAQNLVAAIQRAANYLRAGDVMLLEAQMFGPNSRNDGTQFGLVPIEYDAAVFAAIQAATDAGIIVIEAAGNGSQNLDDPVYQGVFDPNRSGGNSGAFLVTAVLNRPFRPGDPQPTTTIGRRIDYYYWWEPHATAGYGDLQDSANDLSDYSDQTFNASSAASALVAGGVVALQGAARALTGAPLSLSAVRDVLTQTGGTNLGRTNEIGVRPQFATALYQVGRDEYGLDRFADGAIYNPGFEITHGVAGSEGSTPTGWNAATPPLWYQPTTSLGIGGIAPASGGRMLFYEDTVADGSPVTVRGGFVVPDSVDTLTLDYFVLTTETSGALCDAVTGRVWVVDPATQSAWTIATFDLCDSVVTPLGASSYSQYTYGTGWRSAQVSGLGSRAGEYFELNAEVNPRVGASPMNALLLLDGLQFGTDGAPTITSISPASGSVCGGTTVLIEGTGFSGFDCTVQLGGVALNNVRWIDSTRVAGEAPASSVSGSVSVSINSSRGNATRAGGFTYTAGTCQQNFRRGDSNDDGGVDVSDAINCLNYLFLGSAAPPCQKTCDGNDDGSVDISDAVYLLAFLFQGGPQPPAPHPGCGVDPTADTVSCSTFSSCP